jgi:hypothetical protein
MNKYLRTVSNVLTYVLNRLMLLEIPKTVHPSGTLATPPRMAEG